MYAIRSYYGTLKNWADKSGLLKNLAKNKIEITGDDFREGLTAVVSVKVAEPQFEGHRITSYNVCYTKLLRKYGNYGCRIYHSFGIANR